METAKKLKIGLTGHGSGGHFYPLIAVAESLKIIDPEINLIYFGPDKYNSESLASVDAKFSRVIAGKRRNYLSIWNIVDFFKMGYGLIQAFVKLAYHYPDAIFSKGGFAALPVLIAAKILGIPTIIHDSDIVPGRVTQLTAPWARRVALAWPEASSQVSNDHVAVVGNPIRHSLISQSQEGGRAFLHIPHEAVVILVIGGSQGAQVINSAILQALPELLENFYLIHQTGEDNYKEVKQSAERLLTEDQKNRYQIFDSLNQQAMARALGAADIVITRAGAGGLFETAGVGKVPAFVIPITDSVHDHQRKNAYAYQAAGAGIVIEESNLKPDLLTNTISALLQNKEKYQAMKQSAIQFSPLDAADKIATEIIQIANDH